MGARETFHRAAFTLLEVFVVIVVIAILAVMLIPVISSARARAERVKCTANLRALYVAANLFVQQNNSWPQIKWSGVADKSVSDYANAWIGVLEPFGIARKSWICPTIQGLLRDPDYTRSENARIDYTPMPFDDKPTTPHQWSRQPWFVENGDVHGNGNLIVFTDGSISDLKTIAQNASPKPR